MSNKPKYNWKQPSLFSDDHFHPVNKEFKGYKIVTNKNGQTQRIAIIGRTKEDFIRKSQAVWGDQYDYSETVYTTSKSPVTIRCKKHNHYFTVPFAQNHYMKPHGNVKPTGCDLCTAEAIGYYPRNRGPHRFRTEEEKQREAEEKARKREERKQRAEQRKNERSEEARLKRQQETRLKRQQEEQAYIEKWQAKSISEANFKKIMAEKYGDHYSFEHMDFKDKRRSVTLTCKYHGDFNVEPREILTDRTDGRHSHRECPVCEGREVVKRMTSDEFFQRMHQLYDATELDFMNSEFKNKGAKVTAYCRKHGAITHPATYWLDGKGCEYCNGKFYPQDFLQMARKAQGQEYTYRGVDKITSASSRVMVHCGNPDHKWHRMLVSLVLQGCKCRECAGRHQSLEERKANLLERVKEKFGDGHFQIAIDEYTTTHNPITVTCLDHNYNYKIAPDILLNGAGGCPFCSASEGEAVIKGWLDNHGIPHTWHAQIPNEDPTLPLQYVEPDFWLEHLNLYIEYHGEQHYENIGHFYDGKRIRNFAVQQHRDRYLRDYCQRHGHRLLEIPYWDFKRIDEILSLYFLPDKE